jgi:hypothetical protein
MREIQNSSESDSYSDIASETGASDSIDEWLTEFEEDFDRKPSYKQNNKIIGIANKKISLLNYLKNTIKLRFEVTSSPSGWDHQSSCPFKDHNDNSPSFYFNSKINVFKCHGCGRGGGPVQFIAAYTNRPFIEVAEDIISKYGNLESVYDDLQDEIDNTDIVIIEFTDFLRAFIRRNMQNNKIAKIAENVMWSLDLYIEKHAIERSSMDEKNLIARIHLLKQRLRNYEQKHKS